jgi:hypothetical protein
MSIHPFITQMLMEERIENALQEAEKARLVKMVKKSKSKKPLLPSALGFMRAWLEGRKGSIRLIVENLTKRGGDKNPWQFIK